MTEHLTSMRKEVNGSNETETVERFERKIVKEILLKLTEKRNDVTVEEILYFLQWALDTKYYSEDVAVVVENWLQENDYFIFDNELYFRQLMETPTSV